MTVPTKKRKTDEVEEGEVVIATVAEAWESMKKRGPALFKSLAEYVKWTSEEDEDPTEMMVSHYYKSAEMENKFIVPPEFEDFITARDGKGKISRITDVNGDYVEGVTLSRILVYGVMQSKGYKALVAVNHDDGSIEVLAIPGGVQIVDGEPADKEEDYMKNRRVVYTYKAGLTVYPSPKVIEDVLSLGYVGLSDVNNLLKALNALEGKEDVSGLEVSKLVDTQDIRARLVDADAKQSRLHFFQTLLAARISDMGETERVATFNEEPSYTLANNLELRLPHNGPCWTSLGNKKLTPVPLSSLGADDRVLLSTNIISHKEYKSISGDTSGYLVFKDSDNLGGRRNGKFAKMNVKFTLDAAAVSSLLSAISKANDSEGNTTRSVTFGPQGDTSGKRIELD